MSEIEKMYKLADVQSQYKKRIECKEGHQVGQPCGKCPCIDCDKSVFEDVMPPFTAGKQLELIKWLMNYPMLDEISLFFNEPSRTYNLRVYSLPEIGNFRSTYTETQNNFEDMLCGLINNLWQDLTEAEKQQVKGILE